MNTNPKCIVNWAKPTLRWYRPNILCMIIVHCIYIFQKKWVQCIVGGSFYLQEGLLEISTHITEWYFCFMKVIGHGCLGRLQYSSSMHLQTRIATLLFFRYPSPQPGTFLWLWKINPLHSSNKNILNTYLQFLLIRRKNQSWVCKSISYPINSLLQAINKGSTYKH